MKSSSSNGASGASSATSSTSASSSHRNESDPLDENYITLLQYRDAFHIFNLSRSREYSSRQIIEAYKQTREETMLALSKCEEQLERGRNAFFMSQANFFELKLRALDQALGEMIGEESLEKLGLLAPGEEGLDGSHVFEGDDTLFDEEPVVVTPPSHRPKKKDAASSIAQSILSQELDAIDDLDTIDICFQSQESNGIPLRATRHHRKFSHSTDLSSVSWDGSKWDYSDDERLERLLGPLGEKNSIQPRQQPGSVRELDESPKGGVIDFPQFEFVEPPTVNRQDANRRQRPPTNPNSRPQLIGACPLGTAQSTIEAARKGVLRALSEDDSECLPLEDDGSIVMQAFEKSLEDLDTTNVYGYEDQEEIVRTESHTSGQLVKNSPVKSVKSDSHHSHSSRRSGSSRKSGSSGSQRSAASSRTSTLSKTAGRSKMPALETVPSSSETEEEYAPSDAADIQKLNGQKEEDGYYSNLFLSGLDLAEDICCWWDGTHAGTSPNIGAEALHMRDNREFSSRSLKEEESTFSEECTLTDGESTAFNSTSTYGMEAGQAENRTSPEESYIERMHRGKNMLV
jgi:hypothetical protein